MKHTQGLLILLLALGLSGTAFAQKISICIDFNNSDTYLDSKGNSSQLAPSILTPAQQAIIIAGVQDIYAKVVGAGNVSVKNAKDGVCGDSHLIIVSNDEGPGDEFGDANIRDNIAVVHEGMYRTLLYTGDTIISGIWESAAHEAAHLILGLEGHNPDPKSIFCPGSSITDAQRRADHREFGTADSLHIVKTIGLAVTSTAPQIGSFAVDAPITTSVVLDEYTADLLAHLSSDAPMQFGYMGIGNHFIGGPDILDNSNNTMCFVGNTAFDLAIRSASTQKVYPMHNYGVLYMADPIPATNNTFSQGMVFFNIEDVPGTLYLAAQPGSAGGSLWQQYGNMLRTINPLGGVALRSDRLTSCDVTLMPKFLVVDDRYASTEDVYWYPPNGLEIVDGSLLSEYFNNTTLEEITHYWVMLSDGSCVLLKFTTSGLSPNIVTTVDVEDVIPGFSGFSAYSSMQLVDGPLTELENFTIIRYDPTKKIWEADTAGLGSTQVQSITRDDEGRVYAATNAGLYTQLNTSLSWKQLTSFPGTASQVVFADHRNHLFATSYEQVYVSTDHGSTWKYDTTGIRGNGSVSKFGEDMVGNAYAIRADFGRTSKLFRSAFGTAPWVEIGQSVSADAADHLEPNAFNSISGDSTSLSLATQFGVYVSTNMGSTWTARNESIRSKGYYSVVKNSKNEMFLSTDLGVFSGNYQDGPWTKRFPTAGVMSMSRRPLFIDNADNLYTYGHKLASPVSFGYAIARSTDDGVTWVEDSTSMSAIVSQGRYWVAPSGKEFITSVAAGQPVIYSRTKPGGWVLDQAGFVPRTVAVGTESFSALWSDGTNEYLASTFGISGIPSGIIWKYTSGTWSVDSAGMNNAQVFSFAKDNAGIVYAGAVDRILKYEGNHWTTIPMPGSAVTNIFNVSCDASGALFATGYSLSASGSYLGRGVYFTLDQGQHWVRTNLGDSIELDGLYSRGDTTYVQTTQGVFAFTSKLWATSYIPEGVHSGSRTTTIHAGDVKVGATASIPIRITNFGNTPLQVTGATSTSSQFGIIGVPASAQPGEVIHATLQFTPAARLAYTGTIVVTSNSQTQNDTIVVDGNGTLGDGVSDVTPDGYALNQNHPNPAGMSTTIDYSLGRRTPVSLTLYDALGREMIAIEHGTQDAGTHHASFDASKLPNGMYFYTLRCGEFTRTKALSIMR